MSELALDAEALEMAKRVIAAKERCVEDGGIPLYCYSSEDDQVGAAHALLQADTDLDLVKTWLKTMTGKRDHEKARAEKAEAELAEERRLAALFRDEMLKLKANIAKAAEELRGCEPNGGKVIENILRHHGLLGGSP